MPFFANISYEKFALNSISASSTVHTILKCFVDQNLQLNENSTFNYTKTKATFEFSNLNVNEGDVVPIKIKLNTPSVLGIEEVDLYFLNDSISGASTISDINIPLSLDQPARLSWSAGEQNKFIILSAYTDFLIENTESFNLKLDHFVNCDQGQIADLKVNIQDTTVVRTVGIESTNGSILVSSPNSLDLIYNIIEGSSKEIIISLDSPSVFGVEEIDVLFVSPTSGASIINDYTINIPQPIRLSWSAGEQYKSIILSAVSETDYFENQSESINIQLTNPLSVLIATSPLTIPNGVAKFSNAIVYIENNAPQFEYTRVYLGPFATQPGRIAVYPSYNVLKPYASYSTGPNGYNYIENSQFFLYDYNGNSTFHPALNPTQTLNNFSKDKLRIDITNSGNHKVQIENVILNVGQTIYLTANTLNYFIDLPANVLQTTDSSGNTIVEGSSYEFNVHMSYTGNSLVYYGEFKLKNLDNTMSTNKTLNLGNQIFNSYTQSIFSSNTNSYYLITKFLNIGTGRSGISCPTFGFISNSQENAAVDGLYFIDNYSQTDYVGVEFRQSGGINYTCNTVYNLPYEIIP